MHLKLGTVSDLPDIIRMAREFHDSSPFSALAFDETKIEAVVLDLLSDGTKGIILLSEDNTGMLAAAAASPIFSSEKMATEVMFWVDPEHRGSPLSRQLLEAYEYWAQKVGCTLIQMVSLETGQAQMLDRYYRKKGYAPVEHAYLKKV